MNVTMEQTFKRLSTSLRTVVFHFKIISNWSAIVNTISSWRVGAFRVERRSRYQEKTDADLFVSLCNGLHCLIYFVLFHSSFA